MAMTARRLIYASGGTTTSPFTPPSESGSVAPGDVSQPRATSSGLAVVILCGVTLAFYHGLWLPGLVLIKRDAFRFFLPLKEYLIQRLDAGELPHWFPYEGLGRSFIGVAHTGVFHPFTALYFFTPVPDAYRVSTLLTCVLAGLGTFMLGRMLRVSRTGALFSGLAFTLSGYVVSLTDNLLYLYSICVLPLFCAGLEKALRDGRMYAVAPAALWATVFLNGDIQTGYYYIFIGLLWATARAPESYREAWLRLGLTGVLAALLAGVQLGPAWLVFVSSERADPALFFPQTLQWSTHPLRLVTVLASPVGKDADPVALARFFFGTSNGGFWAESLYLGVPLTGLAILGIWHRRDLLVLTCLGGLALFLSLGRYGGLYELFSQVVPLWSVFRYPEKFMGVVSFALAMLAGAGVDALRAGKGGPLPWATVALLCAGTGIGFRAEAASVWVATTFGTSGEIATQITDSIASASLWSAAAGGGVSLIILSMRSGLLHKSVGLCALVTILILDLARANLLVYHTAPAEAATFVPPLAEAIQASEGTLTPGRFRIVSIRENVLAWPKDLIDQLDIYGAASIERRQALDVEHNAQFHLETVLPYLSGFGTMFAETLNPRTGIEVAARLNVTYYIGRRYHLSDPRFAKQLVAQLPPFDLAVFRNPILAKPRAYLSRQPERAAGPVDPVALFGRSDFLSGEVDVIETKDEALPGRVQDATVIIEHYGFEEVRIRVETPRPAVLILVDAFEKGWRAVLETGEEIPILRANALVRAVVVPSGTHVVTFSYRTPLLKAGAAASLAGCLLCLGLITHAWWRHRHPTGSGR